MKDSTIVVNSPGYQLTRKELQIQIDSAAGNTKRQVLKTIRQEIETATDPVAQTCAIAELHDIALSYEGYVENLAEYIAKLEAKNEE